jgi:hypothetical protein
MQFRSGVRIVLTLLLPATGLFADNVVDSFNIGLAQPSNTIFGGINDIGWYYTPSESYTLNQIETLFSPAAGTNRTITFAVFTDRPANGGTLIESASFAATEGTLGGPIFATGIPLIGGDTYFVALEGISDSSGLNGIGVNQVDFSQNSGDGPTGSVSPGTEWQDTNGSATFGTEGCSDTTNWFCKPEIEFLEAPAPAVPEPDTFILLAAPVALALLVRRRITAR